MCKSSVLPAIRCICQYEWLGITVSLNLHSYCNWIHQQLIGKLQSNLWILTNQWFREFNLLNVSELCNVAHVFSTNYLKTVFTDPFELVQIDEVTGLLNFIQLFEFFRRCIRLQCDIHYTLNYRFRAAAECISHCCAGKAPQYLQTHKVCVICVLHWRQRQFTTTVMLLSWVSFNAKAKMITVTSVCQILYKCCIQITFSSLHSCKLTIPRHGGTVER